MAEFAGLLASSFTGHMVQVVETIANKVGNKDSGSSRSHVKDPSVFDGSDPRKVKTFLVSLALVFADCPSQFNNQQKVSYAISYLDGPAREWFESDIVSPDPANPPAWMYSYDSFVQELINNFGVYEAEGEAEDKLANLQMKETDTVHNYMVKFNTLTATASWDEFALQWAFRRGLASRIKEDLARLSNPPDSLTSLRKEAQSSDYRYWSCEQERKRDNSHLHSQPSLSKPTASLQPEKKPWNNLSSKSAPTLKAPDAAPKLYTDKLDKDGKLSAAERLRRIMNKLCLFCGFPGHRIDQCNKHKSSEDLKAHAFQTTPSATSSNSEK